MSQTVEQNTDVVAAGGDPFTALLGKYARRDGAGNLVLVISSDDLTNIGALMAQALFGYLLNKEVGAAQPSPAALAAVGGNDQHVRGS